MLKTMRLKNVGVLKNGAQTVLVVLMILAILLVSIFLILSGILWGITGIVQLSIAVRDALPWTESKAVILTLEGNWLKGLLDIILGSVSSASGWGIFHFLFPEKRKPKRLRRNKTRKGAKAIQTIPLES